MFNTMLDVAAKTGDVSFIRQLVSEMKQFRLNPGFYNSLVWPLDSITYAIVIDALGNSHDIVTMEKVFKDMKEQQEKKVDVKVYNSYLSQLKYHKLIEKMNEVFHDMKQNGPE